MLAWMIDPTGKIQGQIAYTRVVAVPRFNDIGTWKLDAPLNPTHAKPAAAGWRIMLDDGSAIYGGPVAEAEINLGPDRRPQISLSGVDDMMWLGETLAWPTPGNVLASQTNAYDIRTGTASTVLRAYVDVNIGPSAQAGRQLGGLSLAADPSLGSSVTGRARFVTLLELLQGLAITGGVGFRMTGALSAAKTFDVYQPRDLTGPARFSLKLGNLRQLKWTLKAPGATTVIGGGRGEETARSFISVTNSTEEGAWGRREDFYDFRSASGTDSNAELTEGTTKRLTEQAATRSVEAVPIDTQKLRFGRTLDYWLGDKVTVDVYGTITLPAIVREAEITWQRTNGQPARLVVPRIGDIGTTNMTEQWSVLRDAIARVSRLERR